MRRSLVLSIAHSAALISLITSNLSPTALAKDILPNRVRDANGNHLLGTVGGCGPSSFYLNYLDTNETYHCGFAEQMVAWAQTQNVSGNALWNKQLCTFGIGEFAPPKTANTRTNFAPTQALQDSMNLVPTANGKQIMIENHINVGVDLKRAYLVGSSAQPRLYLKDLCAGGATSVCGPSADSLAGTVFEHNTALTGWILRPELAQAVQEWRTRSDATHHGHNLAWAQANTYTAAWVLKVVKCSDLDVLIGADGGVTATDTNVLAKWKSLQNLMPLSAAQNFAKVFVGTANGIEEKTMSGGVLGVTTTTSTSSTTAAAGTTTAAAAGTTTPAAATTTTAKTSSARGGGLLMLVWLLVSTMFNPFL